MARLFALSSSSPTMSTPRPKTLMMMEMMPMTTTTNDLRDRIIAIEGHVLEIEGERSELSYAAMFEGCARSAKRVAEINTELARLANETAVLHAAIAEAGKRDAVAAATKRDAEERANAEKALALLDDFARDGAKLEDAANALVEKFNSLCLKSRQLTALGYPP